MQARIAQKEETIAKYQELLKQARDEMQDMNQRHQQELRAMQQKVHMNNDAAFSKFKQATQQFLARQTTMKAPSSKQVCVCVWVCVGVCGCVCGCVCC